MTPAAPCVADPVARLCPECALCCNGVLFADVELQSTDDASGLAGLGLTLERKRSKTTLLQPCSCLDGRRCRIYPDRPARCRSFECRLLQRVQAGTVPAASALLTIRAARRRADAVRDLVRRLGDTDERAPLSRRYARVMAQPEDLGGDALVARQRGELLLAVHELTRVLGREFLG